MSRAPIIKGPMRKVVQIDYGTVTLECGHIADSHHLQKQPKRKHCYVCLPLEERRKLAESTKTEPKRSI